MLENGVRPELALRGDKLVEKHRLHGDTSDMGAQGFAFHREKGFWREFGGFANYLNLEYYPGPLEGNDQVLAPLSQFLKGKLGAVSYTHLDVYKRQWQRAWAEKGASLLIS